ncbi:MAG TPA: DUF3623 family protein [Longimicrobiales bacterium]|nr:DUF3623 family protein [Longimicrobiales bacterium]
MAARGGRRRRRWSFAAATAMMGVALTVLPWLAGRDDTGGVLLALLAGFSIWAWVEFSFYTGYVTGPSRAVPLPGARFRVRLRYALAACLWHELVIPVLALVIWILCGGEGHLWSPWIYLTFWVLYEVAHLNVLAGVPHPFSELLPDHLGHLKPHLEPARAGWVLAATPLAHVVALVVLVGSAVAAVGFPALLGWAALTTLVALGWVEHLVLLPLG